MQSLNFDLNLLQLRFFLLQYVDDVLHNLRATVRIRLSHSGSTPKPLTSWVTTADHYFSSRASQAQANCNAGASRTGLGCRVILGNLALTTARSRHAVLDGREMLC
jgi:hypothetical protein